MKNRIEDQMLELSNVEKEIRREAIKTMRRSGNEVGNEPGECGILKLDERI